jgi:hypothetical protein
MDDSKPIVTINNHSSDKVVRMFYRYLLFNSRLLNRFLWLFTCCTALHLITLDFIEHVISIPDTATMPLVIFFSFTISYKIASFATSSRNNSRRQKNAAPLSVVFSQEGIQFKNRNANQWNTWQELTTYVERKTYWLIPTSFPQALLITKEHCSNEEIITINRLLQTHLLKRNRLFGNPFKNKPVFITIACIFSLYLLLTAAIFIHSIGNDLAYSNDLNCISEIQNMAYNGNGLCKRIPVMIIHSLPHDSVTTPKQITVRTDEGKQFDVTLIHNRYTESFLERQYSSIVNTAFVKTYNNTIVAVYSKRAEAVTDDYPFTPQANRLLMKENNAFWICCFLIFVCIICAFDEDAKIVLPKRAIAAT